MTEPGKKIMEIDKGTTKDLEVGTGGIRFTNANEVMEFAKMMAASGSAVPKHLRGQPGSCLGVIDDAIRFDMSPYALARKSYFVNDNLAYEAQVFAAIVHKFAPLRERPSPTYDGEGNKRVCRIVYRLKNGQDIEHKSPEIGNIYPKNSPLWKSDPDQQLAYYTLRSGARRLFPEIVLGIIDYEEAMTIDVTPEKQSLAEKLADKSGEKVEGFNPDNIHLEFSDEDESEGGEKPSAIQSAPQTDDAADGQAGATASLDEAPATINEEKSDKADSSLASDQEEVDSETGADQSTSSDNNDEASNEDSDEIDRDWLFIVAKNVIAEMKRSDADIDGRLDPFRAEAKKEAKNKATIQKVVSIAGHAKSVVAKEMEQADAIAMIAGLIGRDESDLS